VKQYLESFLTRKALAQFIKVGLVGVVNTVVSFALFNVFLVVLDWSSVLSVTLAFAVTTFVSYLLNRVWAFDLRDGKVSGRETVQFYLVNGAAWAGTAGTMWMAETLFGPLSDLAANGVYLFASVVILIPKYASYRDIVFGSALADDAAGEAVVAVD
jgi:putative flippase GtrA